jgi:cysteine-S-conjugate beta-lyase
LTEPFSIPLDELRRRGSMKWRAHPDDVLPLWVAEMDVRLAVPVVEALTDAVTSGDTGYPVAAPYVDALAGFARRRWGWTLEAARTRLVPDVMQGVVEVLGARTGPGDPVIVNPPVYPPFFGFIGHAGRGVVEAPLAADHRLDLEAVDRAMGEAVRATGRAAYLLCNPHNPTGTVHTADELAEVARLAGRHGVLVVTDEIHAPLVLEGARHVPYLSVPGTDDGVSLLSGSKGWNLAGCKAALAVAGEAAATDLERLPGIVGHGASHLGVIAHTAAFRDGGSWLDTLLAGVAANQRLLADLLAQHLPGVRYRPAAATYLAWLDCRELGLGDDPARAFLEHGRVALNRGLDFGTGGQGHVRLNLATSSGVIEQAVERMASAARPHGGAAAGGR